MDPPEWKEQALMSEAVNPIYGLAARTIERMAAFILALHICAHILE